MDFFKINLDNLSKEQQAYFKSPEFQNLSPSAKISIARERLAAKPSTEEAELKRKQEDEGIKRIYEERHELSQNRIQNMRLHLEDRKRRYLD